MTAAESIQTDSAQIWITGLNHIALPVRDLAQATRFWTGLFGAEPFGRVDPNRPMFHFRLPGLVLALFERPGTIDLEKEYPHYAFTVTGEGMRGLKARLDKAGVRTHALWTRNRIEALMYFRDPSGNLFELYCPDYDRPAELELFHGRGGSFRPPIGDLHYDWRG